MSVISTKFFNSLKHKPKVLQCNRPLGGAGGETLIPKGECFLQVKIGKKTLRDCIVIVNNLNHDYILGTAMQRSYHMSTGFSITGRHFLSVKGHMVAQSVNTPTLEPIIKTKGKIKLNPYATSIISNKTPPNIDINHVCELNHKFSLPSGVIPIDVIHTFDHKIPWELKILIFNTNNSVTNITKNTAIVSLRSTEMVDNILPKS